MEDWFLKNMKKVKIANGVTARLLGDLLLLSVEDFRAAGEPLAPCGARYTYRPLAGVYAAPIKNYKVFK